MVAASNTNMYQQAFLSFKESQGKVGGLLGWAPDSPELAAYQAVHAQIFQELLAAQETGTLHPPLPDDLLQDVQAMAGVELVGSEYDISGHQDSFEVSNAYHADRSGFLSAVVMHGLGSIDGGLDG